jgi:hypothetical protein
MSFTNFEIISPPSENPSDLGEKVCIVEKTVQKIRNTVDEKWDEDLLKTKVNFYLKNLYYRCPSKYTTVWNKSLEL